MACQILKLGVGQNLNQHRDYHNHPDYPNHTMKFGKYRTHGERYSITLYTPGKLGRLTAQDWDTLAKAGFPIYLCEPLPARMRRPTSPSHVMSITPESERIQHTLGHGKADEPHYYPRSHTALVESPCAK